MGRCSQRGRWPRALQPEPTGPRSADSAADSPPRPSQSKATSPGPGLAGHGTGAARTWRRMRDRPGPGRPGGLRGVRGLKQLGRPVASRAAQPRPKGRTHSPGCSPRPPAPPAIRAGNPGRRPPSSPSVPVRSPQRSPARLGAAGAWPAGPGRGPAPARRSLAPPPRSLSPEHAGSGNRRDPETTFAPSSRTHYSFRRK